MTPPDVLRLHQTSSRIHHPHRAHGPPHAFALVEQDPGKRAEIAPMRMPQAVEAGEARGRERLVYRRVVLDPGETLGEAAREIRQTDGEARIEQAARQGPRAVMQEADDGPEAERAQAPEARRREGPVRRRARVVFPKHGQAQRAQPERGEAVEVVEPPVMAGARLLVLDPSTDANVRTLRAAPEFQG